MEISLKDQMLGNEKKILIIPAQSKTLGGISYHYKEQYFPELEPYIDFDDFQQVMTDVNETVKSFWPCFFTICLGYVLCPVTLGLSLLLPRVCMNDAEKELKKIVDAANLDYFNKKGAHMEFKREFFKSWFQITLPNPQFVQHQA